MSKIDETTQLQPITAHYKTKHQNYAKTSKMIAAPMHCLPSDNQTICFIQRTEPVDIPPEHNSAHSACERRWPPSSQLQLLERLDATVPPLAGLPSMRKEQIMHTISVAQLAFYSI
jgi:hypothetical protein